MQRRSRMIMWAGVALVAGGCGQGGPAASLLGTWQSHEDTTPRCDYTFNDDGTFDNGACDAVGRYEADDHTLVLSFVNPATLHQDGKPYLRLETEYYQNGVQLGLEVFRVVAQDVVSMWSRRSKYEELDDTTGASVQGTEVISQLEFGPDGAVRATTTLNVTGVMPQSSTLSIDGTYQESAGALKQYDVTWPMGGKLPPGTVSRAYLLDSAALAQLVLWLRR